MRFTKSNLFIVFSIAFAGGVLIESLHHIPKLWLGIAMAFFVAVFAWGYQYMARRSYAVMLVGAALFAASLGVIHMQLANQPNQFASLFDTKQQFEGLIVSDIDLRSDKQLFQFQPKDFSQKILITAPLSESFAYGDQIVVIDKLEQAKNFEDFNYQQYLEKDNIYAVMRYPKVLLLKAEQGNIIIGSLLKLKHLFVQQIENVIPESQSSLLLGILIGAKKTIPDEIINNFNATGTSHIVAVSGYNITVIIFALAALAKYLGRKTSFWLSVTFIIGFIIITGLSASVLRAAIMGFLLLLSLTIGRLYRIIPALCFAALVMILINPKIVLADVGFQLSFMATLGIILFVPIFEQLSEKIPNPAKLKTIVLGTIAATLATAPLILLHFQRFSVIAPLANVAVLPLIPVTMLFGFVSVIPILGYGFGYITQGLLWYIINVTRWLSHVPYASLEFHIDGWIALFLYFDVALLYLFLVLLNKKRSPIGRPT